MLCLSSQINLDRSVRRSSQQQKQSRILRRITKVNSVVQHDSQHTVQRLQQQHELKGILCDLDGVIFRGDKVIPGAPEVINWLIDQNIPHLFLTNTATQSALGLCQRLNDMNVTCRDNEILSPAAATLQWIEQHDVRKVALFIHENLLVEFRHLNIMYENVEAVVLGDMGEKLDYKQMNKAFRLLMDNESDAPLISLGKSRYFQDTDGPSLDVGPFTCALEFATGKTAIVLGKPAAEFFKLGAKKLGLRADNLVMIGDDIRTDIQGAQQVGMQGWLVQTGKFKPNDLKLGIQPDQILSSIQDLPAAWEATAYKSEISRV
eukprot:TRINITY_DN6872_c0_g1_i2.p1 TRINITY_DN6872_c0_g1~~TRINITY_DN6872_c0_g1_i2.p1  ORF type:complete len:319 (+),score=32.63 TRINITY_DN6872_c0_g1_i2:135-1091(+)